jgi:hypothetical protein
VTDYFYVLEVVDNADRHLASSHPDFREATNALDVAAERLCAAHPTAAKTAEYSATMSSVWMLDAYARGLSHPDAYRRSALEAASRRLRALFDLVAAGVPELGKAEHARRGKVVPLAPKRPAQVAPDRITYEPSAVAVPCPCCGADTNEPCPSNAESHLSYRIDFVPYASVACAKCGSAAYEPCRSKTGRLSWSVHAARRHAVVDPEAARRAVIDHWLADRHD